MPKQASSPGIVVLGSDFKALGVIRSLGRHGIPCVVVDNLPRSAWFSRYVSRRCAWNGPMEGDAFVNFLLSISKQFHLEQWMLIPAQDDTVELVTRNREQLSKVFQLVTQDWEVMCWAHDKRMTYRMAAELGIPHPHTSYPGSQAELEALEVTFPAIIKPAISIHFQHELRLKAIPVNDREELLKHFRSTSGIIGVEEIMVQEIIPGNGRSQFSIATYCKNGEILLSMTARRTRQYPIDYGLGSSFVEALEVPDLLAYAEKLLRHMRVTGMVEVEFKQDPRDQQYKLLDINVRPWGWHTLCIASGLDFPYIQYQDVVEKTLPLSRKVHYGRQWVRLLTDVPAGLQEIRAGISSPGSYLRSLIGKNVFSVFDWRDPLPAIGDFAVALSRFTKMLLEKAVKHE
jgi:predicted ATP-grasp superfamily ATP-dependent carboligase